PRFRGISSGVRRRILAGGAGILPVRRTLVAFARFGGFSWRAAAGRPARRVGGRSGPLRTIRADLSSDGHRPGGRPKEGSRRSRISDIVRTSRRTLLAVLVVLLSATGFGAQGSVPAGWQTQSDTALAPGVDHQALTLADPAQSVNVATVAPGAARLAVVSSHDAVAHQNTGGELPSDMCRRVGCLAGINADFADPASGEPLGGVVDGGVLLRSPVPGRTQLLVTGDGHLQAGPLDWSGTVSGSDVDLYTPAWAGDTPDGADIELVLQATGPVGAIGATTALQITGVRSDPGPILAGGHPAFPDAGDSFSDDRHPRSLIGWNASGEIMLVTVDGGRDGASGMTMAEAAGLLTGLGATDGFGYDN